MNIARLWLTVLTLSFAASAAADRVPPGTDEEIRERLQPFGQLCRAGEDCAAGGQTSQGGAPAAGDMASAGGAAGGALSGEQVYNQFCGTCHNAGIAGSPVLGDAAQWEPRLAKGMDTLWDHTLNGFNAMPAKGTCMNCSDEELRSALDYMVGQVQ